MKSIAIIYYSGAGHTAKFAEAVGKGVASVSGVALQIISIKGSDIVEGRYKNDEIMAQLDACDTIIFGTPTYMASIAAQFKAFADASVGSWFQQKWRNKIAAGFTVSGTPSGDKLSTLQYLQSFAMQHGMIWVGTGELPSQPNGVNRLGAWMGAMAYSEQGDSQLVGTEDLLSGEVFGKRVAEITKQFNG